MSMSRDLPPYKIFRIFTFLIIGDENLKEYVHDVLKDLGNFINITELERQKS